MYFAQNVNYLLARMQWSKADLARATKISPPQIGRYLKEERQPKIENGIAIAKALNVNLDDLILLDMTKAKARPFGAEGEDDDSTDATLDRMNELLEQRVRQLEEEIRRNDPDRARELGIE